MKTAYYLTPSSFCFGVKRSIDELNKIIDNHPNENIYCVHELVHNPNVNQEFIEKGVIFVEESDEIKETNCVVIFSAHGINRKILNLAKNKFKIVYNLECPLVTKIYNEIDKFFKDGIRIFFYIGKEGHQEGQNVMDYIEFLGGKYYNFLTLDTVPNIQKDTTCGVLSQTTLNKSIVEDIINNIKNIYPNAQFPPTSDICNATYERQTIINKNLEKFEGLIVIGGKNSSNTKELVNIGERSNKKTFFGENLEEILVISEQEILDIENIAITGGASTPEQDIRDAFEYLKDKGYHQELLSL